MFDSATVCFTEVDEFKQIARVCNPMQLFDLLNNLYKTFDARIDNHDVYKAVLSRIVKLDQIPIIFSFATCVEY